MPRALQRHSNAPHQKFLKALMKKKENHLSKPTLGLIGLGIIGSRVALRLRQNGYPLFVWNRSPRPEPHFLASSTEVAQAADIILLFVRDGIALLEVLQELSPSLTARHFIINHATVSPQQTLQASQMVTRRGATFLEAPFTGSRDAAAKGELVYFVGGTDGALEHVRPILEASSKKILMMGPVGAATYIKIANNLVIAAQVQVLAEALEFLRMGGIPLQYFGEALENSAARSDTIMTKLPQMLRGDFEPRFSTKNMLKDLRFALDVTKDLPTTAATVAALENVVESGFADADYAALATNYSYSGKEDLFSLPEAPPPPSTIKKETLGKKRPSFFSFLTRLFQS